MTARFDVLDHQLITMLDEAPAFKTTSSSPYRRIVVRRLESYRVVYTPGQMLVVDVRGRLFGLKHA
jgi:hypothetical protein